MNPSPLPHPTARHAHRTLPVLHGPSVRAGPVFTVLPVFSCVLGTGHNSVTCVPCTVLPVFLALGTNSVTCVPGTVLPVFLALGTNSVTCVPGTVLPVFLVLDTTVLPVFLVQC